MASTIDFLDQNRQDITARFADASIEQSWGGGKGTAERSLVYVFLGIVALFGAVLVRYFLV